MKTLYQIATGTSVREEATDYIVENNQKSVEAALKELLNADYDYLGTYSSFQLGNPDKLGNISLKFKYVDCFGDLEEETNWELRPVKFFA
tara:strand:- start:44 stop:313 length:270 start_codon:yes stop_codon:yes gene_type:complete